ncbi:MAG: hypothetical protein AB1480_18535 [Nitrospirota bacterium]
MNKNGLKELIVTDFGRFGDHIDEWKEWKKVPAPYYNLFILEWEKSELKNKWSKRWDMTKMHTDAEADRYFVAFKANQMVSWQIGDRIVVETIPPYLGIEWLKDKYVLHEQQGPSNKGPLIGSWVFPWLSASCYQSFVNKITWPRECLIGIRDFLGNGNPMILTIKEKNKNDRQILTVRKFDKEFAVEKELIIDSSLSFGWWSPGTRNLTDRLNWKVSPRLLMFGYIPPSQFSWYSFGYEKNKNDYYLRNLRMKDSIGIISHDLPDIYLRKTQKKDIEEYWGYCFAEAPDKGNILLLRRVFLKPDLSGFIKEDINFDHNKAFLGVGFFDLKDLDGDGLDEVILLEETGKREFGEETIYYSDTKDYIRILKWDGKKYKTMWVSPPYTKRGTKFLVEDIKNSGKKQLVVMTSNGTIQIWERK